MGSRCATILTPWDSEGGKKTSLIYHGIHLAYSTNISSPATVMERKLGCRKQGGQRAEVPRNRRSQRYTVEEEATWADHWEMLASRKVGVVLRSLTEETQLRTFLRNARGFVL